MSGRQIEQRVIDQIVIQDAVGLRKKPPAFPGDQIRISGARADEIDFAHPSHRGVARLGINGVEDFARAALKQRLPEIAS